MAPDSAPRHPRAANLNSKDRGRYNAASILPGSKSGENADPVAAPSGVVVSLSKAKKSTKKSAKGKETVVDSDVDPETDDEGRVAPRRRPNSIRQGIIEKDSNYFRKQQAAKANRDRQAALSAENTSAENDTAPKATTKSAKKSAVKKPITATTKSSKPSTIQDGRITKGAKVKKQQQKPKRQHRPSEYGYETVPDDSDDVGEGKSKTIAKLRETIDRHAHWCPFVRIKKRLHRTHRRTTRLERLDSEDNNEITEPEEDIDENHDEDDEQEEDQSNTENDDGEDTEPSEKQSSKNPALKKSAPRKPAPKKAATGRAATKKAPASKAASSKKARFENPDLSKEREETSDDMEADDDSERQGPEADESEDEDGADKAAATTELDSDEQLSSLDDDKVGRLHEAHEHEQNDLSKQAAYLSSDKDTSSQKRKRADLESGQGKKMPAKKQSPSA